MSSLPRSSARAKKPCLPKIDHRDAGESIWSRDIHTEKVCNFRGDGLPVDVGHAAIERAEGRERADIVEWAGAAVRKMILGNRQRLHTCRNVVADAWMSGLRFSW